MTLPAGYTLPLRTVDPGQVGMVYHLALGTKSTPSLSSPDRLYGFMLAAPEGENKGFAESTDLQTKAALQQNSSPNLIDRDLVNTPRETVGDFSGGALQEVLIDATRFYDSDLEIRQPGYLTLRPAWQRQSIVGSLATPTPQSVAWNNDVYTTFQGASYYSSNGTGFAGAAMNAMVIDTDGSALYIADGVNTVQKTTDNAIYTVVSSSTGPIKQMWVVNLGTAGRRLYFTTDNQTISFLDLNATFPVAPVSVALGSIPFTLVDVVGYQNGVAILTKDQNGFDVWSDDGTNLTRIIRVNQFSASGMCVCLGDLYVTAQSVGQYDAPVLVRVSSATFEVLANTGSPLVSFTAATIGAPVSSGQYVYFTLAAPQIAGISAKSYVAVYDAIKSSYSHLGNLDATDAPQVAAPRQLAFSGRAVAFPFVAAGTGYLQFQTNSSRFPAFVNPVPKYAASGWLVSAKLDFSTPSISKLLRRLLVHHAPLNAGEQVQIDAHVDQDPVAFTTALAPNPTLATVTNSTASSTTTVLSLPTGTLGKSMYFALKLTAGTNQVTTPVVYYVSAEIAVGWTWKFTIGCYRNQQTLQNVDEQQGLTAQDKYWFLHELQESAVQVTFYHPNQLSYVCAVEKIDLFAKNPIFYAAADGPADLEFDADVVLRWTQE